MKKLLYSFLILGILFAFVPKVRTYATAFREKNTDGYNSNRTVVESVIDGVVRMESFTCYETSKENCEEDIDNKNYKYVTLRLDVAYADKSGEGIAAVYIESNFRYNINYKEVKCLSTSHGELAMNGSYKATGFARTKNATWSEGGAYGTIKFEKESKVIESNNYTFKCDFNGCTNLVKG